jgi:hypothetical protein
MDNVLFGWIVEHLHEELGLGLGGFVAYVAHQTWHVIWRRPARWLVRRITRKEVDH